MDMRHRVRAENAPRPKVEKPHPQLSSPTHHYTPLHLSLNRIEHKCEALSTMKVLNADIRAQSLCIMASKADITAVK